MDNVGIKPITEKFLQNNYLFALEFREGFVFGRVIRRRICHYKPYPLIDTDGTAVDISPGGHQAELSLVDPRNTSKEILYLDTTTKAGFAWIMHGSIGIKPQYIYMYPRFPSGQDIPGKFPYLDAIHPSDGDNLGYVSGLESPYEQPTDFVEYIIPPLEKIGFEFYNKDPNWSHQPVLNILFAIYFFQVLRPERHAKLISDIATRRVPAAFFTVGFGDQPIELGDRLATDWNIMPMRLDEAAELGERR